MLYRGISVRETAMMLGVPEKTVRMWLYRDKIKRTRDGRIDVESVRKWWDQDRDRGRGNRKPHHRARFNPYDHPDAPSNRDRPCSD